MQRSDPSETSIGVDDEEIERWASQNRGATERTPEVPDDLALRRLRRQIAALTPQNRTRSDVNITVFNHAEEELRRAREALLGGDYGRPTEFGLRVAAVHGIGDAVLCLIVLYRRLGWHDLADAWLTIALADGWEPEDVADADQHYRPAAPTEAVGSGSPRPASSRPGPAREPGSALDTGESAYSTVAGSHLREVGLTTLRGRTRDDVAASMA